MSNITEKILEKIKENHIAPKPRWHFVARQALIWFLALASVLIGSATFSLILFRIVNNDWEVVRFLKRSPLEHVFGTLPYIWLGLLAVFIVLAYYNARHAKGAYKYQGYWFIAASIVISLALGGIFYAFGLGPRVHILTQGLPFFDRFVQDREEMWLQPENGLLAGEVRELLSGDYLFVIEDFQGEEWTVLSGDEYIPPPIHFTIEEGVLIRLIGEQIEADIFSADRVMPYNMGPGIKKGGMPGGFWNNGIKDRDRLFWQQ